jgi:hypothetical protein
MLRRLGATIRRLRQWIGWIGDYSRLTFDPNQVPWVGILLCRTGDCTTHSGIAFRDGDNGDVLILHMANHLRLSIDPPFPDCIYSVPELLAEDEEYMAGFCRRIHSKNSRSLLYSFEFDPDITFDGPSGGLLTPGAGLSCATFVAAVFRSAGNPLVRVESWPPKATDADVAARRELIKYWRGSGKPYLVARADEIEPTIRDRRVSPPQVIGASLFRRRRRPVAFSRADPCGRQVAAALAAQLQGPPTP